MCRGRTRGGERTCVAETREAAGVLLCGGAERSTEAWEGREGGERGANVGLCGGRETHQCRRSCCNLFGLMERGGSGRAAQKTLNGGPDRWLLTRLVVPRALRTEVAEFGSLAGHVSASQTCGER